MSSLSTELFPYTYAWYLLACRYVRERGMRGNKFSEALLKLAKATYESAWPMATENLHGTWAGCAWYSGPGIDKLASGTISHPAKYLFSERKHIVRTMLRFLEKDEFIALEKEKIELAALLRANTPILDELYEQFGIDGTALVYRGPVVVGWQHYPISQHSTKGNREKKGGRKKKSRKRPGRREKIYWLGILPRNVVDLHTAAGTLSKEPAGRALLMRGALDLFHDPGEESPVGPDPRVAARALTLLHGGKIEEEEECDFAPDLNFGDGRRSYLFWYEKKLQPTAARFLKDMTRDDRLVWYLANPTNEAVREIMGVAKSYAAQPSILVLSTDMIAAIIRKLPWTLHQRAGDLRTIYARSEEAYTAQLRMLALATAMQELPSLAYLQHTHLRVAWTHFGSTSDFEATLQQLADSGLLVVIGTAGANMVQSTISHETFISSDHLVAWLPAVVEWMWTAPELTSQDRSWLLESAVHRMRQLAPEYGNELYARWRKDFPNDHYVLLDVMWSAIHNEDWTGMRDAISKLVALGERDMIDVAMKQVFTGRLAHEHRVDALLGAAKATLETGRGTSYAVNALLRDYERPDVAAFLRAALARDGGIFLVLRDVMTYDQKLAAFILDTVRDLPMDQITRKKFNAVTRSLRSSHRAKPSRKKAQRRS